jgi:hypothetical protein
VTIIINAFLIFMFFSLQCEWPIFV